MAVRALQGVRIGAGTLLALGGADVSALLEGGSPEQQQAEKCNRSLLKHF